MRLEAAALRNVSRAARFRSQLRKQLQQVAKYFSRFLRMIQIAGLETFGPGFVDVEIAEPLPRIGTGAGIHPAEGLIRRRQRRAGTALYEVIALSCIDGIIACARLDIVLIARGTERTVIAVDLLQIGIGEIPVNQIRAPFAIDCAVDDVVAVNCIVTLKSCDGISFACTIQSIVCCVAVDRFHIRSFQAALRLITRIQETVINKA